MSWSRRTIGSLLPKEWSNLYSVGRLDYESEGLIFLTNDGEFSLRLTHPRYEVRKKYVATVAGRVGAEMAGRLTRRRDGAGERLKAERARVLSANNSNSVVELELAEGTKPRSAADVRDAGAGSQPAGADADWKNQAGGTAQRQMADIDRTGN